MTSSILKVILVQKKRKLGLNQRLTKMKLVKVKQKKTSSNVPSANINLKSKAILISIFSQVMEILVAKSAMITSSLLLSY